MGKTTDKIKELERRAICYSGEQYLYSLMFKLAITLAEEIDELRKDIARVRSNIH